MSVGLLLIHPDTAGAYSVLAHEAMVDSAWDDRIEPLLRHRFPESTEDQRSRSRAYAYGGSVIHDLGYFPFGSKQFTDLVHYARSGDFVEALIREARSLEEYAFALGALAHYACDDRGHPLAVNRVVPLMYPKVRAEFGDSVLYVESPARHLMVEFAFDVLHVAQTSYAVQAYRDRIGFEVAMPLLERAFHATYGIDLEDLFASRELAVGTYRRAVSTIIPEVTRLAWEDKQDEIRARMPGIDRSAFVFSLTQQQYDREFGRDYKKPSPLARFVFLLLKIVPKVGPLRPLAFEPLTPEAQRLFLDSFEAARARYRRWLTMLRRGPLTMMNVDLDVGQAPTRHLNPLAERTYAKLLELLARTKSARIPPALLQDINAFYASRTSGSERRRTDRQERKIDELLARLNATAQPAPR